MFKKIPALRKCLVAAGFALPLCVFSSPSLAARVIDGFKVSLTAPPTADRLPAPKSVTGTVAYVVGTELPQGTDPFAFSGSAAGVSPYLAIEANGSATFIMPAMATRLSFLWGSIDHDNAVEFFDANNHLIGTLSGYDINTAYGYAYGQTTAKVTVVSSTPFASVVLVEGSSGGSFEFSDFHAY